MQDPFVRLGTRTKTNVPTDEVQRIDVAMAQNMRKVQLHKFDASKHHWTHWQFDFETAMSGASISEDRWVEVLPLYLDDASRDMYEEVTAPRKGNQYIKWKELAHHFTARYQEKINPNMTMLQLCALKFDRNKDDFADFATEFLSLVAKAFNNFDSSHWTKSLHLSFATKFCHSG